MAEHKRQAQRLNTRVFFANPYSPWHASPREHRWLVATIHLQGHGLVGADAARAERHCPSPELAPEKMPQLFHTLKVYTQLRHHSPVKLGT
jgi:hypothetical protein